MDNSIKLSGKIINAKFNIEFNDQERSFYQTKIKLSDKKFFIKERNRLFFDQVCVQVNASMGKVLRQGNAGLVFPLLKSRRF